MIDVYEGEADERRSEEELETPKTPTKQLSNNSPLYPTTPTFNSVEFYRTTSFQSILSPSESPNQRDVLINRINELTIEKSELTAKLFKQEKQNEELLNQNMQLIKKTEILDEVVKSNFNLQQNFNNLQEKNTQLLQTIDKLRTENSDLNYRNLEVSDREEIENCKKIVEEYENIQLLLEQKITQCGELFRNVEDEKIVITKELNDKITQLKYELEIKENNERNNLERIRTLEIENFQFSEEVRNLLNELQVKHQIINDSAQIELADEISSLTNYIEQLKQENFKLHQDVTHYYSFLLQSQSNMEKLTERYENEIDQLRKLFEQSQRSIDGKFEDDLITMMDPSFLSLENEIEIPGHFYNDLHNLRDEYKKITWEDDVEMEEIQNHKIHQLLDEINLLEILISRASDYYCNIIHKFKMKIANLNSSIVSSSSKIANLLDENEKLLYAVETGDLQPYLLLQEKKNRDLILQLEAHKIEQEKQNQILNPPSDDKITEEINNNNNNESTATDNVNNKSNESKGRWFSWFKFL